MIDILNMLKESTINRKKQTFTPDVIHVLFCIVLFNLFYIFLSVVLHPADKSPAFHFRSEEGAITALSAIYLAMASGFSITALIVNIRLKSTDIWFWSLMAFGFALLSLDELLQFHETAGRFIRGYLSSGIFRGWNDVIVIVYGLIALPFLILFFKKIISYPSLIELFILAFVLYGIHTVIDSTQQPQTPVSVIIEESFKLFCGSMLALAALTGFLGSLQRQVNGEIQSKKT